MPYPDGMPLYGRPWQQSLTDAQEDALAALRTSSDKVKAAAEALADALREADENHETAHMLFSSWDGAVHDQVLEAWAHAEYPEDALLALQDMFNLGK